MFVERLEIYGECSIYNYSYLCKKFTKELFVQNSASYSLQMNNRLDLQSQGTSNV